MPAPAVDLHGATSETASKGVLQPRRDAWPAIRKGLRGCCPACGKGKIFRAYLKVNDECPKCGEELHHHRADDAPPYMTIFVAGHIVGSLLLMADKFWPDAPLWLHAMIWPTLALILCLWLLPIMKGGLIAYQWALRMHGFDHAGQPAGATGVSSGK
ncbi:MAG: DUF983 domain-containing protein [Beijerinckiaceae bacterium]|nr:DUF983 domain-containing protein [Beijerinckiaceae bacterium]MCI0736933.1 DUF983 domain-containing protein [Beijerinckiaceae bacterium]